MSDEKIVTHQDVIDGLHEEIATKNQALLARDANCVAKDKIIMSLRAELARAREALQDAGYTL